jgi:hypothetical protein
MFYKNIYIKKYNDYLLKKTTMDIFDKFYLSARLLTATAMSIFDIVIPDIFTTFIEHNIKRINTMLNINNHVQFRDSNEVQECIQSNESGTRDVAEESSGSCSEHGYDKVSTSSGNRSESDEGEVSSK